MLNIWRAAAEQFEKGEDFVLAVITAVRGSSPRHVGTRFLVRADRSIVGTIGGGMFEARVQRVAAQALEKRTAMRKFFAFTGKNAESTDMICGGDAEVLVEFIDAADSVPRELYNRVLETAVKGTSGYLLTEMLMDVDAEGQVRHLLVDGTGACCGDFEAGSAMLAAIPDKRLLKPAQMLKLPENDPQVFLEWIPLAGTVYIFGGGHVGRCTAHMAAYVGFKVVVVDDRAEFASPEQLPDADQRVVVDSFEGALKDLDIGTDGYVVIVTRGHRHDKTVLQQALGNDCAYIGMIGSKRKTSLIFQALMEEGARREDLERVHAPIGLPIGGETPEEIAVSIVAQMIQVRYKKDSRQTAGSSPP
ncbi:MAG: XdhC family aldehyde oxidoreductase maturation factor [Thermodesulfobacteriota bacterium]